MATNPISFVDYNKITDRIMFFDKYFTLNFTVNMYSKRKEDNRIFPNVAEYSYYNSAQDKNVISIKRNIDCAFVILHSQDKDVFLSIKPKDIYMLVYALDNMVIPWFIGDKRIFSYDNNKNLILKGKWSDVELPLSDFSYLRFAPIVLNYVDGTYKEGIRMFINTDMCYVDYSIDKFFEFYYYIKNTDMYGAAQNMLQFVKTKPYGNNLRNMNDDISTPVQSNTHSDDSNKLGNYFAKHKNN